MIKIRASLMILLFIISFTRCWADSYSLFANSSIACCQASSQTVIEDSHHDDHQVPDNAEKHDCTVCNLVQSGFLYQSVDVKAPLFLEGDFTIYTVWAIPLSLFERPFTLERLIHTPLPTKPYPEIIFSTSRLIVSCTISVRGPNVV